MNENSSLIKLTYVTEGEKLEYKNIQICNLTVQH